MAKLTVKQVADTLRECRGMVTVTARKLGVSKAAIIGYCQRHPACAEARDEARSLMGDVAELRLAKAIEDGDPWAVQFYLKTQCRDRGYGDRQEVSVSGVVAPESYIPDNGRGPKKEGA